MKVIRAHPHRLAAQPASPPRRHEIVATCENITQYLDDGGPVNAMDQHGRPLLHQVVHRPDLIRLLVRGGADTELEFKRQTPLMVAAAHGFADCVAALLEGGADVDYCRSLPSMSDADLPFGIDDDDSWPFLDPHPVLPNALACAIVDGSLRCVELLLEAGANPNGYLCRAGGHPEPLWKAVEYLNLEAAAALLEAGADVASSLSAAQFIVSRNVRSSVWAPTPMQEARTSRTSGPCSPSPTTTRGCFPNFD